MTRISLGESEGSSNKLIGGLVSLKRVWQLRQAVKASNAATILSFVAGNNILSVIACIGLGKRLIISERNDPSRQSLGRIWDFLRKATYPWADLVTANSHGALKSLEAFVPKNKLQYVPNPITPLQTTVPTSFRKPLILNVGRLYPQKCQADLIDAFALIAEDFPEWRLTIAGTGPLADELKAQVGSYRLGDRIDIPGAVRNIEELYSQASIFVLPSSYEGSPNALLEAMQSGIAAIVSDASPGPLEVIEDDETGLICSVSDPVILAKEIRRLIEDRSLRIRLGEAAQEWVKEFDVSFVMATWSTVVGN